MDFPKKYDPSRSEPALMARWRESGIYRYDPDSTAARARTWDMAEDGDIATPIEGVRLVLLPALEHSR